MLSRKPLGERKWPLWKRDNRHRAYAMVQMRQNTTESQIRDFDGVESVDNTRAMLRND
jgi:hypothetical protein